MYPSARSMLPYNLERVQISLLFELLLDLLNDGSKIWGVLYHYAVMSAKHLL
jgi:hypothetical protein